MPLPERLWVFLQPGPQPGQCLLVGPAGHESLPQLGSEAGGGQPVRTRVENLWAASLGLQVQYLNTLLQVYPPQLPAGETWRVVQACLQQPLPDGWLQQHSARWVNVEMALAQPAPVGLCARLLFARGTWAGQARESL